ncbi:ankyrin repeats protein [Halocaridina rubra]|uniref:Ankyrin repeats protein n=1 Tax=Halocaridina rubra TaxID=373956 RepID=A0AAN8ZUU4_HALRR
MSETSNLVGTADLCKLDGTSGIIPAFSTPCKPEPEIYYGLFLPDPSEMPVDQNIEQVYTDKASCLAVMKKYRGSRFKSFSTFEEALQFAEDGPLINLSQSVCGSDEGQCSNLNVEKPSPYRGPKAQDLVKFRKAIERDDMVYFEQCINENPRYLVSSGDTPAILQEGSRYNALHIACRTDRPVFASKVLATISGAQFFQRLYPDDTLESSERRSRYLLDSYLNTPDKGLNETPLHFASKHGSLQCVRVLTSYPDCSKTRRNKYGQLPIDIVCTRSKENSQKLANDIRNLLGDHYYVPLLRGDENCLPPRIGEPWSPVQDLPGLVTEEQQLLACLSPSSSDSPLSPITPTLKVRGFAGPMSPTQAEVFHRRWKDIGILSPTRSVKPRSPSLRFTDQEKGLEKIGRELASSSGCNWNEYWDFLGEFANFSTDKGLGKLERHLKQKYQKLMAEQHNLNTEALQKKLQDVENSNHALDDTDGKNGSRDLDETNISKASQSTMSELCQELEALRLNASLSPQLDSSFKPGISASSKFLQCWKEREGSKRNRNENCAPEKILDPSEEYLSYIYKSIDVAAYRIAEILGDLCRELESSAITNLSVNKAVRTKLKPEILCLRKVLSKCITPDVTLEVDFGFIHILLAFKSTEYVKSNMLPADICVLAETLKIVISNLSFVGVSSSDDDDERLDLGNEERRSDVQHVSCVLRALEKAVTLAYNNCSSNAMFEKNETNLRVHLMQLGDCTCCWDADSKDYQNRLYASTPTTDQKYNKAQSFIHQTLFSNKLRNSDTKIISSSTKVPETIVKQLTYDEDGENVIVASLSVGDGVMCKLEAFEKNRPLQDDNEDNESFATAVSSLVDDLITPDEGLKVFINGAEASKVDADVMASMEGILLDDAKYPHVSQWLHLVQSHSAAQRNSWTTPHHVRGSLQITPAARLFSTCSPTNHHRLWIPSSASRALFRDMTRSPPS